VGDVVGGLPAGWSTQLHGGKRWGTQEVRTTTRPGMWAGTEDGKWRAVVRAEAEGRSASGRGGKFGLRHFPDLSAGSMAHGCSFSKFFVALMGQLMQLQIGPFSPVRVPFGFFYS